MWAGRSPRNLVEPVQDGLLLASLEMIAEASRAVARQGCEDAIGGLQEARVTLLAIVGEVGVL